MLAILGAVARLIGAGGILFIVLLPTKRASQARAGRVHTYAAQQIKLATHDTVTKFERDILSAQLSETERLLSEANRAAVNARMRAHETLKTKAAADAQIRAGFLLHRSVLPRP